MISVFKNRFIYDCYDRYENWALFWPVLFKLEHTLSGSGPLAGNTSAALQFPCSGRRSPVPRPSLCPAKGLRWRHERRACAPSRDVSDRSELGRPLRRLWEFYEFFRSRMGGLWIPMVRLVANKLGRYVCWHYWLDYVIDRLFNNTYLASYRTVESRPFENPFFLAAALKFSGQSHRFFTP